MAQSIPFAYNPSLEPISGTTQIGDLVYGFPVTGLHSLIIPKRHAATYFELTNEELLACDDLLRKLSEKIKSSDSTVEGFNIGLNAGEVAGQTIFHCHFHLIPRRKGDVENPRGGVRHLIPGKGYY